MEEVKDSTNVSGKKYIRLVLSTILVMIELVCIIVGATYLYMVGGLLVRLFIVSVGVLSILGVVDFVVYRIKLIMSIARGMRRLRALGYKAEVYIDEDREW